MTWVRIDDQSPFHPKVIQAGNAAWGALVRLAAYSSAHRLDGFVPMALAIAIASTSELEELQRAKLLDPPSGRFRTLKGVQVHDFLDWNPSAEELEALTKRKKDAGLQGANKRWQKDGTSHSRPNGKTMARARAIPSHPIPSQKRERAAPPPAPPAPSPGSTSSPSAKTRPCSGRLDGEDLAYALAAGFDQDDAREVWERFGEYADAKAWRFTSAGWAKRWRTWIDTERDRPKKKTTNGHAAPKKRPTTMKGDELAVGSPAVGDLVSKALAALEGKADP